MSLISSCPTSSAAAASASRQVDLVRKLNSVFGERLHKLLGISVPFPQPLGIATSDILTYLTSFSAIVEPVQALEREEVPCCATGNLEATLQPWFDSVVIDAEWPSHPQISPPSAPVPNLDGKLKPLGVTEYFAAVVVLAKHADAALSRVSAGEELQADPQRPLEALRVAVELASKHITANLQTAGVCGDEALHLLGLEDDCQSSDEELHTDPKEERRAARRLTQGPVEAEEVVARLLTLQERQSQGEETDDGMSVGSELLESGDTGLGTSCDTSYLSRASSRGEVSGQDKEKDLERSWRLFYPRTADSADRQVMSDDEEEQSDDENYIEIVTPSVLSPQMQSTPRNSPPSDSLLQPSSSISPRLSPGNSAAAAGSDLSEGSPTSTDETGLSSNGGSTSCSPDEHLPLAIECTDKGLNSGDKLHHVEKSHSMSASLSARPRREQAMHLPLLASRHFREPQAEPLEEVNVPAKLWKDGEDLEQRSPDSSSPSSPVATSTPNVLLQKGEPRAAVSSAAGAPSHRTPKAQKKKVKLSKTTRRGWSTRCPLMTLAASSSPLTRRQPPSPVQVTTEAQACSQRHDAREATLTDSWTIVSHADAAGTPGEPMFRTQVEENRERQKKKKRKKPDQKKKS